MSFPKTTADGLMLGAVVRAVISAGPEQLWEWIADPTRHPSVAGSGEPQEVTLQSEGPVAVGSLFQARQKAMGMRYVSKSEVLRWERPVRFHFLTEGRAHWSFQLEPTDGGTRVTHSQRFALGGPGLVRALLKPLLSWRNRQNANGMARTLKNLAQLVGAPEPERIEISYEPPDFSHEG